MVPPAFDDDLGFSERVEDFTVQQFVAYSPVEAFAVSVFPGWSGLYVSRLGSNGFDPISNGLCDELRAVV